MKMRLLTLIKLLFLPGMVFVLAIAAPTLGQDAQPTPAASRDAEMVSVESVNIENQPAPETQQIQLNFNPVGAGRCVVVVTPWPEAAKTAVRRAADIWSTVLNGSQPIVIDVCWSTDFDPNGQLGSCGSSSLEINFNGAPIPDTYYPVSLANQLSGSDRNLSAPEMQCRFNAHRANASHPNGWYMGLDGNVPDNQYDLVTVGLHEIGHGLGFEGSADWDNGVEDPDDPNDPNDTFDPMECNGTEGVGCYEYPPNIYDRFVLTTSGTSLLAYDNNSKELGDVLIGNGLVFHGTHANAANGGAAPRIYAPDPWVLGSSYQHLDEATFNDVTTGLMTPDTPIGEAIHHPGVVALGMLKDMGWEIYDLTRTYVDKTNTGFENGGVLHPFNTANEGVMAVPWGGRVLFFAGSYPESLTISRAMSLESISGTVTLGE